MTAAKATNRKTPAKPKAPAATPPETTEEEGIPALWIKAKKGSIRRCGHRFDETVFGIALAALTDEEVEIFSNDPDLIVEEVTGV